MSTLQDFNLNYWTRMGQSAQNQKTAVSSPSSPVTTDFTDDAPIVVRQVVEEVSRRGIDITGDYKQWLSIGFGLADLYGEDGRELYHAVSRPSPKYDARECDRQYTNCLRHTNGSASYKSLLYYAEQSGITIPISATSASANTALKDVNKVKNTNFTTFDNNYAAVAEAEVAEMKPYTFSDKLLVDDLPYVFKQVYLAHHASTDRDRQLLGSLTTTAGLLGLAKGTIHERSGVYAIYDRRPVFASSYIAIVGDAGSSKGEVENTKYLLWDVREEMLAAYREERAEYEREKAEWDERHSGRKKADPQDPAPREPVYRDPIIPGNTTSSEFYRLLEANGSAGIIIETEADSIASMIHSDFGAAYSDCLRRCFHHETISLSRRTDNLHISIEQPCLSMLLTCTPSQIPTLLPNFEDGLASRFLFYLMPNEGCTFHNVFDQSTRPLPDIYRDLGHYLLPLYHALKQRAGNPLQFVLSCQQEAVFLSTFGNILTEQFCHLGSNIKASVYRMALTCMRFCMVLTVLRKLDDWGGSTDHGIFDPDERALVCDDRDFRTAITITTCLIHHTARVYRVMDTERSNPFSHEGIHLKPEEVRLFNALPDGVNIRTSEILDIGKQQGLSKRTTERMISELKNLHQVLLPVQQGVYRKRVVKEDDDQ